MGKFRTHFRFDRGNKKLIENKTILIIGAGSLGRELAKQLVNNNTVFCLDHSEQALFKLESEVPKVRLVIGDVTNYEDVENAVADVDFVIHTVAKKFVNYIESNPLSAINTNIDGTINIIKACMRSKRVKKMVNISTDKSCYATSTYGLTKAITERLMVWASKTNTKVFATIRLCNFPSDGAVFTTWKEQAEKGQPITITDKRMTRWFLPIKEAATLTLKALELAKGGEIFVPATAKNDKMVDIAKQYGTNFRFIGKRPGERLHETLMTNEEKKKAVLIDDLWRFTL